MAAITNDLMDTPCGITEEAMKAIYQLDFSKRGEIVIDSHDGGTFLNRDSAHRMAVHHVQTPDGRDRLRHVPFSSGPAGAWP